jgi:hypothetical protein
MGVACRLGLLLLLAVPVRAQYVVSVRAGLISFAEGSVYLNNAKVEFSEDRLQSLEKGESLYTGSGWIEIQLGPGAVLRMGESGKLWMENSSLENMQLRIERGSILVEIFEKVKNNEITVHFENAVIKFKGEGLYRLDCRERRLLVYAGKAEIKRAGRKVALKKDRTANLDERMKVYKFDGKEMDELHRWAARRSYEFIDINPDARRQLKTWTHLNGGWMENIDYGVRMYSPMALEEQARLRNQELYIRDLLAKIKVDDEERERLMEAYRNLLEQSK